MAAMTPMNDEERVTLTVLLQRARQGDPAAKDELYHRAYPQLLKLARHYLNGEAQGHTFQPSDLVHEVYLRLEGDPTEIENRSHFYAMAARAMRQVLVEHARAKGRLKRGGGAKTVYLDSGHLRMNASVNPEEILDLHRALDELAKRDPLKATLVDVRYFGGLTREEAAEVLQVSEKSIYRHWVFSQTWLRTTLRSDDATAHPSTE